MIRTLWHHSLLSLPAQLLRLRLLLCTLRAVLHPLPSATSPPHPLNPLLRGLSFISLTRIWMLWRTTSFNQLQEMRANQTRERDRGPPPRAREAREARLAPRRRKRGARKPKPPRPLPTLCWHQCKVINYTKQSRQSVYWLYHWFMVFAPNYVSIH